MNIDYDLYITELPQECIDDCSASGSVDDAVAYWQKKLDLTVNQERARKYLKSTGGWNAEEIAEMDDERVTGFVLWLACGDFSEQQTWEAGNPGKPPEDSDYGSSIFVLEG